MFKHNCLDPHDPFAEREVAVTFVLDAAGIRLLAARDAEGHDILPDLIDAQREDLRCELAAQPWPRAIGGSRSLGPHSPSPGACR